MKLLLNLLSHALEVAVAGAVLVAIEDVELWDSAGSPARKHYGPLAASKSVNSGDTFSFASGAVIVNFS